MPLTNPYVVQKLMHNTLDFFIVPSLKTSEITLESRHQTGLHYPSYHLNVLCNELMALTPTHTATSLRASLVGIWKMLVVSLSLCLSPPQYEPRFASLIYIYTILLERKNSSPPHLLLMSQVLCFRDALQKMSFL